MCENKKRAFTIHEKCTIIEMIEQGRSQTEICAEMNLKKSTVSSIWKNRERIKGGWKINDRNKKMRLSSHPQVEEMLFEWFQQKRANEVSMNGPMLKSKAEEFGKVIGDEFKCSAGWLDRFKRRYNIVFGKTRTDGARVNRNITTDSISRFWPEINDSCSEENVDALLPGETHNLKGEERLTGSMEVVTSEKLDDHNFITNEVKTEDAEETDEMKEEIIVERSEELVSFGDIKEEPREDYDLRNKVKKEVDSEEEEDAVTTKEALRCVRKLRQYLLQENLYKNDATLSTLNKIHDSIQKRRTKNRFVQED